MRDAVHRKSNPRSDRIFANSRIISIFLIALSRAGFCRVLASVCVKRSFACVYFWLFEMLSKFFIS